MKKYNHLFLSLIITLLCACASSAPGAASPLDGILRECGRSLPDALMLGIYGEESQEFITEDPEVILAVIEAMKKIQTAEPVQERVTDSDVLFEFRWKDGKTLGVRFEDRNLVSDGTVLKTEGAGELFALLSAIQEKAKPLSAVSVKCISAS